MRKVFQLSLEIGSAIELTREEKIEARVGYIAGSITRDHYRKQIKVACICQGLSYTWFLSSRGKRTGSRCSPPVR